MNLVRMKTSSTVLVPDVGDSALRIATTFAPITTMKLPGGERAVLGTKLEDYSLNPLHRDGRHKARVFAAALGITLVNRELLRNALLDAAATSDAVVS